MVRDWKSRVRATVPRVRIPLSPPYIYCKEQSKDSFYNEFVLESIINLLRHFWVWQGGGVASLIGQDKTLFLYVR